jgi:hypothetical protein
LVSPLAIYGQSIALDQKSVLSKFTRIWSSCLEMGGRFWYK